MPENIVIHEGMVSEYTLKSKKAFDNKSEFREMRLTSTFFKRRNYVVHLKALQTYIALGAEITKVHKVLTFKQKCFAKSYIETCTEFRKKSMSKYEEDIYKKMSCSLYGELLLIHFILQPLLMPINFFIKASLVNAPETGWN
jgi:hypothetical protein